jgi:hypothetical protein
MVPPGRIDGTSANSLISRSSPATTPSPLIITRYSCYTELVLKNVTLTLPEEVAHWARRKAADENISVSKLLARILENQMRLSDEYWTAYEHWKKIGNLPGISAGERLTRDEAHERR